MLLQGIPLLSNRLNIACDPNRNVLEGGDIDGEPPEYSTLLPIDPQTTHLPPSYYQRGEDPPNYNESTSQAQSLIAEAEFEEPLGESIKFILREGHLRTLIYISVCISTVSTILMSGVFPVSVVGICCLCMALAELFEIAFSYDPFLWLVPTSGPTMRDYKENLYQRKTEIQIQIKKSREEKEQVDAAIANIESRKRAEPENSSISLADLNLQHDKLLAQHKRLNSELKMLNKRLQNVERPLQKIEGAEGQPESSIPMMVSLPA